MGTPRLPPIGFERQFNLKSILRDGGGDESLEVGVFRYKEGPGIGEFLFLFLFTSLSEVLIRPFFS